MAPQEYEFGKKNPIVSNGERGRIERERREQMLVSWMVLSHRVTFLLMFLKDGFCFILEGIAKKEVILKNMSVVFTFRTTLKKKKKSWSKGETLSPEVFHHQSSPTSRCRCVLEVPT